MKNQKRIDQLTLEMQVAMDEHNKIIDKIKELETSKNMLKMKAFSCDERIKELKLQDDTENKNAKVIN
tara:strand:- start:117 stop:320 length:204 start_codon:yes stop_codon:yes gene_type:complete